jgi:hypothetical protein
VRPRPLYHAEGGQRENSRARVIGQHAGISCRPARAKLGTVEQWSENYCRTNGPYDLGYTVDLGEVLANQRNDGDLVTVFYEVDRPPRNLHGFPPANVGVKSASQVVLEDLSFVERPPMVLVLTDVKPLFAS